MPGMNPLIAPYHTLHEAIPFQHVGVKEIEAALLEGIRREEAEIDRIVAAKEPPTFENTVAAMDRSGELLETASTVMYNLSSACTTDELDALCERMAPVLSEHSSNILLHEGLFLRVKAVYDDTTLDLTEEERMLLDKTYAAFERNGATLDDEGKKRFRELSKELSAATVRFAQNHQKENDAFFMHLTEADEVAGLPETALAQARQAAKERGLEGWVVTLKAPSYVPFMTYADRRDLRRQLYCAYNTQCAHENEQNNFAVVRRIVNLRREMAQLLGYRTFAEYALKRRMAGTSGSVNELLEKLIANYLPKAKEEVREIEEFARRTLLSAHAPGAADFRLEPWDFSYYSHKLQLERYDLDQEMLRPYLELSRVKEGVFGLATRLYGITFRKNPDIPVYHDEVDAFEVFDKDGRFLAVLYCDFHPRKGKQSGAWMTEYSGQWQDAGCDHRPHVSIVMNLTQPTEEKPALLTLGEVETFLHEFGHALHGMFSQVRFRSLSGTNVYWDFVELPSQFMENYAAEKDFLSTFARHYETGEPIPDELIGRIRKSRTYLAAYSCMRQVSFCLLDMAYYTLETPFTGDVRAFEREAWKRVGLLPQHPDACMSVQFGHIMNGGYAAGYYSYKWAEVLDADAFAYFRETGIFNPQTAASFRDHILSRGGTRPPMQLYRQFRGAAPGIEALMRRDGILPDTKDYARQQ